MTKMKTMPMKAKVMMVVMMTVVMMTLTEAASCPKTSCGTEPTDSLSSSAAWPCINNFYYTGNCATNLLIMGRCQWETLPCTAQGLGLKELRCRNDSDCVGTSGSISAYCQKSNCSATEGKCVPVFPFACGSSYNPVCGCNNVTYRNPCEANKAKVNIKYTGVCDGGSCSSDFQCKLTSFCQKTGCSSPMGTCTRKKAACHIYYDPVCGCDNKSYWSNCSLLYAGVSFKQNGICPSLLALNRNCLSDAQCDPGHFCSKASCNATVVGTCHPYGYSVCTDVFAPVCGCDNKNYVNKCWATNAGKNIQHEGVCDGTACNENTFCKLTSYCQKRSCKEPGICATRPTECELTALRAGSCGSCGCDGKLYLNNCTAAYHGVNLDIRSSCLIYPPSLSFVKPKSASATTPRKPKK